MKNDSISFCQLLLLLSHVIFSFLEWCLNAWIVRTWIGLRIACTMIFFECGEVFSCVNLYIYFNFFCCCFCCSFLVDLLRSIFSIRKWSHLRRQSPFDSFGKWNLKCTTKWKWYCLINVDKWNEWTDWQKKKKKKARSAKFVMWWYLKWNWKSNWNLSWSRSLW